MIFGYYSYGARDTMPIINGHYTCASQVALGVIGRNYVSIAECPTLIIHDSEFKSIFLVDLKFIGKRS